MRNFTNFKMYKRIIIASLISLTFLINIFGQTTIDCRPHATPYWTGRIDKYGILGGKLDGEIKAGSSFANNFVGWAVFDISSIPSNATITSAYIKTYTNNSSSSSSHCLYVCEINVNPITASYGDILFDIGQGSSVLYSGCSDAMRSTGYHDISINSIAIIDLQNNVGSSTWKVGFRSNDQNKGVFDGWNWSSNPTNQNAEPMLMVTYTLPFCYPVIYSADITNEVDSDGDGCYEQWDFEVDVDASGGSGTIAYDVYIQITDDEGHNWGTSGPYDFNGTSTSDNKIIGTWNATNYGFTSNQNVEFSFYAYNNYGNDTYDQSLCVEFYGGIDDIESLTSFNIFPNPNTGQFVLEMELTQQADFEISVINISGQEVYNEKLKSISGKCQKNFDLSNLSKGIYNFQLLTNDGVVNKKIIIQ
ncbi:MAG: T9SS type A sorting domain-containing protein [Bacteroidales bacterium]|nr:T9SS type A sorting domain-containing protein [Bacteroidales bacterium]